MEKLEKFQLLLSCCVIGLCILIAAMLFSTKIPKNETITITGSAYKIVKSDLAKLTFEIKARNMSQKQAYLELKKNYPIIEEYLISKGIKKEDIESKSPNSYCDYKINAQGNTTNEIAYYNVSKNIEIKSTDVNKIKEITNDIQNLIEKGINLSVWQPEYYYSDLSSIKIDLLKEATLDAKDRAKSMLNATGAHVGKVKSMRMGVFQITPPNSTMVSNMGINDTTTIDKKVTAVANVVFKIK